MEDITTCSHSYVISSVCRKCGSLVVKKISAIKIKKYKINYEVHPIDLLENLKNENLSFKNNNNFKNIEFYTGYRFNTLNSFKKIFENRYREETFHHFVFLMDYIFLIDNLDIKSFGTITLGSFVLASKFHIKLVKYNEVYPVMPTTDLFNEIFADKFTTEDIKQSELFCLKIIEYRLNLTTSYGIAQIFLSHGILFTNECRDYKEHYIKVYTLTEEILLNTIEGI
jgi:hypothetical protein